MKNQKEGKEKKRMALTLGVLLISFSLVTGCAGRSKTVHTETVSNPGVQTVVVEEKTSTTDSHSHGILGGAFHVVGEIIAFPFEVIAGLFRFIF